MILIILKLDSDLFVKGSEPSEIFYEDIASTIDTQ